MTTLLQRKNPLPPSCTNNNDKPGVSGSQNSKVQELSLRMGLVVGSFTACWYYTSSLNAVATQQLVQEYRSLGAAGNDAHEKNGGDCSHRPAALGWSLH